MSARDDERGAEYPQLHRIGAYLFFGWLSFTSSLLLRVVAEHYVGLPDKIVDLVGYAVLIVTFLALRDMTKRTHLQARDDA